MNSAMPHLSKDRNKMFRTPNNPEDVLRSASSGMSDSAKLWMRAIWMAQVQRMMSTRASETCTAVRMMQFR
jgi:hypothetical protein